MTDGAAPGPGLADGTHDGIVVDAEDTDDGGIRLSVAIVAGEHKGAVVDVVAHHLGRDALSLLAEPCTLTVAGGRPSLTLG